MHVVHNYYLTTLRFKVPLYASNTFVRQLSRNANTGPNPEATSEPHPLHPSDSGVQQNSKVPLLKTSEATAPLQNPQSIQIWAVEGVMSPDRGFRHEHLYSPPWVIGSMPGNTPDLAVSGKTAPVSPRS